jgi:hypothetical protein
MNEQFIKQHCYFVIGRGRNEPKGYMNFPLNPQLIDRNITYIDPNSDMDADIKMLLDDVDFTKYGIDKHNDPDELIDIKFIFDWSSFYCGALSCLPKVIKNLGRKCSIYVPLSKDEHLVTDECKRILKEPIFTLLTAEGSYPLFDWTIDKTFNMSKYINKDRYILIQTYNNGF